MTRNYSLDSLRTIAVILVVLLHVSGPYITKGVTEDNYDYNFWIGNIVNSFSRVCVPLFVLISGRFLLGRKESFKSFYQKRAARILIPFFIWSLIYLTYRGVMDTALGEDKMRSLFINLLLGRPFYHLWYLYMLLGLYMVSPIVNLVIAKINKRSLLNLSVMLMFLGWFIDLYDHYLDNQSFFLLWFINYLGYFLFGYLMKDIKKVSIHFLSILYLCSGIIIAGLTYYTLSTYGNVYFHNYLSPFVIIGALSFYKIFCQISLKTNILSKIAEFSFGVYLIHAAILHLFNRYIATMDRFSILENPLYGIPVIFAIVFLLSLFITFIISRTKFLHKIV